MSVSYASALGLAIAASLFVIDIDENTYSIGDEYPPLLDAALAKDATAQLVVLRIGFPAAVRIGGRSPYREFVRTEKSHLGAK